MTRHALLALVGGGEHRPGCEPIDQHLLDATPPGRPIVAVVPFASSLRTRARAVGQAIEWWEALGADVLVAGRDAPSAIGAISSADVVVLTGGVPDRLAARLAGSPVLRAIVARHRAGAHVAGSSSGAMVLGAARQAVRPPFGLLPAAGLVPGVAVAPHHQRPSVARLARIRSRSHPHLVLLGIDDRTGLVGHGDTWVVRGVGAVTVARGTWVRTYGSGDVVRLPVPRPTSVTGTRLVAVDTTPDHALAP